MSDKAEDLNVKDWSVILEMRKEIKDLTISMNKLALALEKRDGVDNLFLLKFETINKFIDGADARYASKLSEKIAYSLVSIAVITVLGALLSGVIVKAKIEKQPTIVEIDL